MRRSVNYEDLYFSASQVYEHLLEEYENPAIECFAVALMGSLGEHDRTGFRELAELACHYIEDVVSIELSTQPKRLCHLNCVVEAMRDLEFDSCSIFTLNHDSLIERVLAVESVGHSDGFGASNGDVARWEPALFARSSTRCSLLKLHGSLDWFPRGYDLFRLTGNDASHARTGCGDAVELDVRPRILIGTFNKIRNYTTPPFLDLLVEFRRQLEETDWLIASGYSFGDKGVNAVVARWLRSRSNSRLLVLEAMGEETISQARGVIEHCWNQLGNQRFFYHPAYLSHCSWRSLRKRYGIDPAPSR